MARRTVPPTSRIFSKKKSVWSRLFGTLALTFALAVAAIGIGTAIYLERPHAPARTASAEQNLTPLPAPAVVPAPEHDPRAAAAAIPAAAPPPGAAAPALALVEPQAGAPAPVKAPQVKSAALEAPSAPPPSARAAPLPPPAAAPRGHYWVEYGAFVGPFYAKRLQQALTRNGVESVVVETHGRHGRKLLRVRSVPLAALAAARQAAEKANAALHLAALIHSGSPEAGAPARRYWVQFGAFSKPTQAARLQRRLAHAGLGTTVTSVRGTSGNALFLVRSTPLSTHQAAVAIALRARPLARTDCLVGTARSRAAPRHAARAPPRSVAASN